jgi:hypothetical protein
LIAVFRKFGGKALVVEKCPNSFIGFWIIVYSVSCGIFGRNMSNIIENRSFIKILERIDYEAS